MLALAATGIVQAQTASPAPAAQPEPAPAPLALPITPVITAPLPPGPSATGPALTLEQAIARALAANPQIATADHNIRAAKNSEAANNVQNGISVTAAASGSETTYKTSAVAGSVSTSQLGVSGFSLPSVTDGASSTLYTSSGITSVSSSTGSGSSTVGATTTTIMNVTGGAASTASPSTGSPSVTGTGTGNAATSNALVGSSGTVSHTSQVQALVEKLETAKTDAVAKTANAAASSSGSALSAVESLISSTGQYTNYGASITASKAIDVFGLVGKAGAVLRWNTQFYTIDRDRTSNELALSVKNAYYAALQYQSNIATAQELVDNARVTLHDSTVKYNAGAVAQYDVYSAQSQMISAQQTLIAARNNLMVELQTLDTLMGLSPDNNFTLVSPPLPSLPPSFDIKPAVAKAFSARPEIREADLNIQMARKVTKLQEAGLMPAIGIGANVAFTGAYPGSDGKYYNGALLATISVPLDDAGKTRINVRSAKENETQQATLKQQLQQNIELEVRDASVNVINAQALVESAQSGVAYNRELVRIAALRYRAGAGTLLELTTAQANLASAENSLSAAQYQLQTSYASYQRAIGER